MNSTALMIVDDNPDNLDVLHSLLHENGYEVLPVNSGHMALRALQHRKVDLILLDIRMPDMDGYQVCARLKDDPLTRDIPVIFISALQDPLDKVHAFKVGGVDYISKPFNAEEVFARIATHLQLRGLQQQLQHANAELEQRVGERTAELERRNESLYQANAALEKALHSKKEFLMLMNHELHTPLNGILGIAQVLRARLNSKYHEELDILEASGWRMLKLVDDILQMAREGVVSDYLPHQPIDTGSLCACSLRSFEALAARKYITLKQACEPLCPLDMALDASRLRQVITNLLDNAVKFTPIGGEVELQSEYDNDAETLILRVRDTGPGIPEDQRQAIFEPFVQLSPVATREHDGVGLGLALTHKLVTLHGGSIEVRNLPGGGCVFSVHLPAKCVAHYDTARDKC